MNKLMSNSIFSSILVIAVLIIVVLSILNYLNQPKIGFIDSSILMEKYPSAVEARNQLSAKLEEWQKSTLTLETELNQLNQEIIEKSQSWNKTTIASKRDNFMKKQNEYARYKRAIQEKAAKLEEDKFQPVYNEINAEIKQFGEEKGFDIILGTLSGGNILYADDAANLTEDFLSSFIDDDKKENTNEE